MARPRRPPEERFWERVQITPGCWLWLGAVSKNGYGNFGVEPRGRSMVQVSAHVYAYTLLVGPVPAGMHIDHVWENGCTSKLCVNALEHLEAVTPRENSLRYTRTITHCPQGHEYNEENTFYSPAGARRCRPCTRDQLRASRARKLTQTNTE